jgi:hypothetical protein
MASLWKFVVSMTSFICSHPIWAVSIILFIVTAGFGLRYYLYLKKKKKALALNTIHENLSVKIEAGKAVYNSIFLGKHNGHMPTLVLAPYRLYVPILLGFGIVAIVIFGILVG